MPQCMRITSPRQTSRGLRPEGETRNRLESVMLSAMEHLVRHHPASYYGYWERRPSDLAAFEELERRPVPRRHEDEAEDIERTWLIGELAAAAAIVVVACAVLAAIVQWIGESTTGQQSVAAVSDATAPD